MMPSSCLATSTCLLGYRWLYIRIHNTDPKNRLTAYAAAHPGECRQTDADPDTGCMEFEIRKGRFLFPSDRPIQRGTPQGSERGGEKVRRS